MTLADLTYTIMAIVSLKVYYYTASLYGMYFPFLLFCGCGLFTATFVYFVVPETKGKTLEEIQMILKGEKPQENKDNSQRDEIKMTDIVVTPTAPTA